MRTVGIDLAASPATTAAAVLDWDERPTVRAILTPADDDQLVAACAGATRIGIDCPLGWPQDFVDFVLAHRDGRPLAPAATVADRRPLAYRATDRHCIELGMRPLSVAADRIAHATFRGVALLPRLDPSGDRSGAARVVETYPAGSLRQWGDPRPSGYKGRAGADRLAGKIAALRAVLPLHFAAAEDERGFMRSDHAFDAVVAAVTARLAELPGALEPIPDEYADRARIEGWIAVPRPDSLARLAEMYGEYAV